MELSKGKYLSEKYIDYSKEIQHAFKRNKSASDNLSKVLLGDLDENEKVLMNRILKEE